MNCSYCTGPIVKETNITLKGSKYHLDCYILLKEKEVTENFYRGYPFNVVALPKKKPAKSLTADDVLDVVKWVKD